MARCREELFPHSRSARSDCLICQEARGSSAGRTRLCTAGGDFWFRPHSQEFDSADPGRERRAGNPERMLRLLCEAVGVEFSESMLSWPPGLQETDGIWAKHWYGEVARSTSFRPYRAKHAEIPAHLREVHERCRECYELRYECRLC